MVDNVKVNPGRAPNAIPVKTIEIGGIHYPVYMLASEEGVIAYVDQYSGAVGVIDQEHLQIHKGYGYTLGARFILNDVAPGNSIDFLGVNPAGNFPHYRYMAVALDGGPFDIDFYEGTVTTDDGTEVVPFNNNRNSTNTADLKIYSGPTITPGQEGTLLEPILVPASKQTGALGSEASNEWNLKVDTKYLIRITNNKGGGGTSRGTANMFWYES